MIIENLRAWHKEEEKLCLIRTLTDKGAFLVGIKEEPDEWEAGVYRIKSTDGRFCLFEEFELLKVVKEL